MLYLIGLNFALRSGDEHRNLTVDQFEIDKDDTGEFLLYSEKTSKCYQRGLKDFGVPPKCVRAYASDDRNKCVVAIFRKYCSLRPTNSRVMYLRPLVKPRDDQWYSQQAVGKHTLQQTVGKMCKQAGFEGFYSNHSLRATCATRLFQSGIDEQLIARTTGHRSTAVREYKRVSTAQEKESAT
ncbi:uncharacterized protein LOC124286206 [Haliotis rubra]|uniref:uncharacterized protein LOC124286206 n=1 Tax=Haliotis rubra TaxID=36100 RepID=UPI001EE533AA|nr:uncharacterized protein LOC124286206 [Haliotis rubra]